MYFAYHRAALLKARLSQQRIFQRVTGALCIPFASLLSDQRDRLFGNALVADFRINTGDSNFNISSDQQWLTLRELDKQQQQVLAGLEAGKPYMPELAYAVARQEIESEFAKKRQLLKTQAAGAKDKAEVGRALSNLKVANENTLRNCWRRCSARQHKPCLCCCRYLL